MTAQFSIEQKILQCIDDALQSLGDSGKKALYYHLEKRFGLKRKEIPKKPEIFLKGLRSIFGEEAAGIIQNWIVERLKINFNLRQKSTSTLAETIAIIRVKQKESSKLKRK